MIYLTPNLDKFRECSERVMELRDKKIIINQYNEIRDILDEGLFIRRVRFFYRLKGAHTLSLIKLISTLFCK